MCEPANERVEHHRGVRGGQDVRSNRSVSLVEEGVVDLELRHDKSLALK